MVTFRLFARLAQWAKSERFRELDFGVDVAVHVALILFVGFVVWLFF